MDKGGIGCGRCAVEGGDKGRERDIGCADGARWRAGTRGGSAISGAGGDKGRERDIGCADGARWRAWTRCAVEGGDKGRERDIGCADGARWRAGQGAGARYRVYKVPFCQNSLWLGFRVPGLTLFSYSKHSSDFHT